MVVDITVVEVIVILLSQLMRTTPVETAGLVTLDTSKSTTSVFGGEINF